MDPNASHTDAGRSRNKRQANTRSSTKTKEKTEKHEEQSQEHREHTRTDEPTKTEGTTGLNTNWTNKGWGAHRAWEQGSANETDVKEVLGGKETGEKHRNTGGKQNTRNTREQEVESKKSQEDIITK